MKIKDEIIRLISMATAIPVNKLPDNITITFDLDADEATILMANGDEIVKVLDEQKDGTFKESV